MKCHILQITYKNEEPSKRLYLPNKAVLGYNSYADDPEFFSDRKESIELAEKTIKGKKTNFEYLGPIELPDKKINELIESFKTKEQAEKTFQKKGRSLISLIK